jgi:hypothetical protein
MVSEMKNITLLLFTLPALVLADSITATSSCRAIDGAVINAQPTCSIGPYAYGQDYIDVSGQYTLTSTVTALDYLASLSVGANASFGDAAESVSANLSIPTPGPQRNGYVQITGDGWGFTSLGYSPGIAHPQALLNGVSVLLNLSDGFQPDVPYIIPLELGVPFILALSAGSSVSSESVVGGFAGGGVSVDIQIFEDPPDGPGKPVSFIVTEPRYMRSLWLLLAIAIAGCGISDRMKNRA